MSGGGLVREAFSARIRSYDDWSVASPIVPFCAACRTLGMWWAIAVGWASRPGAGVDVDALIVTTLVSVFMPAGPTPGKGFSAGTSPPASRPEAKASDKVAVVDALNDQVRPCWYMKD